MVKKKSRLKGKSQVKVVSVKRSDLIRPINRNHCGSETVSTEMEQQQAEESMFTLSYLLFISGEEY